MTMIDSNRTARFAYAEKLARADSDEINATLEDWLLLWRDVTRVAGGDNINLILNLDRRDAIVALAEQTDVAGAAAMQSAISETQQHIDRNVNARLALDVLLLKMPRFALAPAALQT
jgi:DNA polymerase-3 subunit delta'